MNGWWKISGDTFLQSESDADSFRNRQDRSVDAKAVIILVVTAISLTGNAYVPKWIDWEFFPENAELSRLSKWVLVLVFFYFVFPALVIRFVFRETIRDYGLRFRGAFRDYWLYILMLGIMVPLVYFFSSTDSFRAKYPFYRLGADEPLYPGFWTWELLYFLQFFALEFFFRGFMVHGLKYRLGFYSVFVMMVPYCMIHFGKPLPETLAAIIAGTVLGVLSLKSRSILLGVAIHFSVGLMMDLAVIWGR